MEVKKVTVERTVTALQRQIVEVPEDADDAATFDAVDASQWKTVKVLSSEPVQLAQGAGE